MKETQDKVFHSKSIAFVAMMAAVGLSLSLFSTVTFPIGAGVSVDLSHVGTYIVALTGGPILGLCASSIVGIIPAFQYTNPMLIPGKAMTGVSVGFLSYALQRIPLFKKESKFHILMYPIAGICGYIPEFIFTVWNLNYIGLPSASILSIIIKAWIEIIIITVVMTVVLNLQVIKENIETLLGDEVHLHVQDYLLAGVVVSGSIIFMMALLMGTGFNETSPGALQSIFFGWLIGVAIFLAALVTGLLIKIHRDKDIG
ncbi:hypothetical protein GF325_08330 [Candidatus Bathyarchaeota archaeon]|nr:hypothetical protein [Candidatus Bathyarchaeota archaeon]